MHERMVPAQDSDIDGAEGDIVDVPAGEAVPSQSFIMSGNKEDEESAAPAAAAAAAPATAAESGGVVAMARDRLPLVGRLMPE
jgi:hypothetical protein